MITSASASQRCFVVSRLRHRALRRVLARHPAGKPLRDVLRGRIMRPGGSATGLPCFTRTST